MKKFCDNRSTILFTLGSLLTVYAAVTRQPEVFTVALTLLGITPFLRPPVK